MLEVDKMEPLILIIAAGEGKRLRPLTENTPKPFIDIGDKKLIDLVMEPLPQGIERAVLLKITKKFHELEKYLRQSYGFSDGNVLYQDRITTSPHLPRQLALSELPLAYYLAFLPTALSRNSRFIRQFDPVVLVPADIIVEGLNYKEMIDFHTANGADLTMPVKEEFVTGSNTRVYTVNDGRLIAASDYVHPPLNMELAKNERLYTHEGTYVLGRRFFDLPLTQLLRKDHRQPPFEGAYRSLKFVPYGGNFEWIDVRHMNNLERARQRYGKR